MRIGFACGMFDLFHAGHVMMLKECKANCDYLIVALNNGRSISQAINPGKRNPFYTINERKLIVESCRFVDQVVVYNSEEELYEIMKNTNINVRFLGDDYKGKPITGSDLDIEIYYTNRDHGISTTSVLQRIVGQNSKQK